MRSSEVGVDSCGSITGRWVYLFEEVVAMPTYLTLLRYTQTGIQNIKESPTRLDAARQLASSLGVDIKSVYLTMGRYDLAVVLEAPDDSVVAKFALAVGSRGAVSTETLRAFPEDEYRKIISELP